jgi:hypothetical protein
MQIVDLIGGEHGSLPFMGQKAAHLPDGCCWQERATASNSTTCNVAGLLLARL